MQAMKTLQVIALAAVMAAWSAPSRAETAAPIPTDIDPKSGNRLPVPTREGLSEADAEIFDALTHGQQAGVRFYNPKLARALNEAQGYLKNGTGFGDPFIEIAVLVTTRAVDSQVLWTIWEKHAWDPKDSRRIDPKIVDIIAHNKPVTGLGEKEALFITFGRELFSQPKVSSETFAHAVRLLGRRGTVDLVALFSQWSATCAELRAFDQQLPAGMEPSLPPR